MGRTKADPAKARAAVEPQRGGVSLKAPASGVTLVDAQEGRASLSEAEARLYTHLAPPAFFAQAYARELALPDPKRALGRVQEDLALMEAQGLLFEDMEGFLQALGALAEEQPELAPLLARFEDLWEAHELFWDARDEDDQAQVDVTLAARAREPEEAPEEAFIDSVMYALLRDVNAPQDELRDEPLEPAHRPRRRGHHHHHGEGRHHGRREGSEPSRHHTAHRRRDPAHRDAPHPRHRRRLAPAELASIEEAPAEQTSAEPVAVEGAAVEEHITLKDAKSKPTPSIKLLSLALERVAGVADVVANWGNSGRGTTGHNAVGSGAALKWFDHEAGEHEGPAHGWAKAMREATDDAVLSGLMDELAGGMAADADLGQLLLAISDLKKAIDEDKKLKVAEHYFAVLDKSYSLVGNVLKMSAGIMDAARGSTNADDVTKFAGEIFGVSAGTAAFLQDIVQVVSLGNELVSSWGERTPASHRAKIASATHKLVSALVSGAKTGVQIAKLEQQRQVGEVAIKAGADSAQATTTALTTVSQSVLSPLSAALNVADFSRHAYKLYQIGARRKGLLAQRQILLDRQQASPDGRLSEPDKAHLQALDFINALLDKRVKRRWAEMAAAGVNVGADVLSATGFGAIPGMVMKGAVGGAKLGNLGKNKVQQWGRDKREAKLDRLEGKATRSKDEQSFLNKAAVIRDMRAFKRLTKKPQAELDADERAQLEALRGARDDARKPKDELTFKEKSALAFTFNEEKSSGNKAQHKLNTVQALLSMEEGGAMQAAALRALNVDAKGWAATANKPIKEREELLLKKLKSRL